jgi:hypothetical protein
LQCPYVTDYDFIRHILETPFMSELFIDLEWWTCPSGFRLANRRELFPEWGDDEVVVPNSAQRVPYRPLTKYGDLYNVFANIKSSTELVRFCDSFGPLSQNAVGDSVADMLRGAEFFRELLHHKQDGSRKLASFFKSLMRDWAKRSYERTGGLWPGGKNASFDSIPLVATVSMGADPEKGVRLMITTDTLIGGLLWQLGQKLSGSSNFRECRQCGRWFEAGPGTARRVDAEFCSDDHRVRFNSLKRSKGGS